MNNFTPSNRYWPETHVVENIPMPLEDFNVYTSDEALVQVVAKLSGSTNDGLKEFGSLCGEAATIDLGFQANQQKPELHTHDRYGNRVDEVRFHPAYHELMRLSSRNGLHCEHWENSESGHHVLRAAKSYLMTQVEAGHGCPITMTSASIPALKNDEALYKEWAPKILSRDYDGRNVPHTAKRSVTIGMAMTEKQGGSDVRANATVARRVSEGMSDRQYELVGHKYFVSAPMSDAFLVLARTEPGISCFLVPRWRPDGSKNPLQIQKLKNKMGNVSNASSETELRGALGWLVGTEGKGIATILNMVAMTRFDCMIGSSAGMRQAVAQATHHCATRSAFGKTLQDQPLMQNVLAELILESEASLALTMRMASGLEKAESQEHDNLLVRLGTAVGKYWICKRTPGHAYEAMECIGGMGVMEDSIMPRLFRESPINAIWEGSGNVQCLDMIRAMKQNPKILEAAVAELESTRGYNTALDAQIVRVKECFADLDDFEYRSRSVIENIALALQASSLFTCGNERVAEAFCEARLVGKSSGLLYGGLSRSVDCSYLINRATPQI